MERDGEVGIITIADPPLNLVGPEVVDDLERALEEAHRTAPRALLLRAEGENFSAGAHVAEMFQDRNYRERGGDHAVPLGSASPMAEVAEPAWGAIAHAMATV